MTLDLGKKLGCFSNQERSSFLGAGGWGGKKASLKAVVTNTVLS